MVSFSSEVTPPLFGQQLDALVGASSIDLGARGLSSANTDVQNAAILNAANVEGSSLGAMLVYPPGIFPQSGTVIKNKTQHQGAGRDTSSTIGTVLLYTGVGDGVQINNPVSTLANPASTAANISFDGITFKNANRNAGKGCFADTGSTDLKFRHCAFIGSDRGLIFDQTELADVIECDFEGVASQTALWWIVNGADRNAGATTQFTNRISAQRCQFNGQSGTILIVDDGGVAHTLTDNNYNGGANQLRAAGVLGLTVSGGEWESAISTNIVLDSTSLANAGVSQCSPVLFLAPVIVPTVGQHCITIFSAGQVAMISPFFGNTAAVKCIGPANANSLFAFGIQNGGGGANFDSYATTHFEFDHSNGWDANAPLKFNGVQIVGARQTGWTAATGTPSRGAFAAAAAGTASAGYVQAEAQAALTRIAALEARMVGYDADFRTHGLIGT